MAQTCPSCGARHPDAATTCDLCGTPLDASEDSARGGDFAERRPGEDASGEVASPEPASAGPTPGRIYCTQCGAQNPAEANFCSQCGARLHRRAAEAVKSPPPATTASGERTATERPPTPSAPTTETAAPALTARRLWMVVGVAVLLVAGLYVVTSLSAGGGESPGASEPTAARPAAQGTATSDPEAFVDDYEPRAIPSELGAQVDSLEAMIADAEGVDRQQLRMQRVNLLVGAGAVDRAALAQWRLARETGTTDAWRRAGRLVHDWMSATQEPQERRQVAALAIEAYEQVLERVPDDVDARTMLATAYIETNNPMRGVQEIKRVLEQDPQHVQALFNYGIMLAMIGRAEQSIEQFETVKRVTEPASPHYREADRIISEIRRRAGTPAADSSAAPNALP